MFMRYAGGGVGHFVMKIEDEPTTTAVDDQLDGSDDDSDLDSDHQQELDDMNLPIESLLELDDDGENAGDSDSEDDIFDVEMDSDREEHHGEGFEDTALESNEGYDAL